MEQSYTPMTADLVITACTNFLQNKTLKYSNEKAQDIRAEATKRRFFGLRKPRTVRAGDAKAYMDEVRQRLESHIEANMAYDPEVQHVLKLHALATVSWNSRGVKIVHLTASDAALLFPLARKDG